MSNTTEKRDWLRLARTENVGPVTFFQLIERYGTASAALKAIPELAAKGGLRRTLHIPSALSVEEEMVAVAQRGGQILTARDAAYPAPLAAIADPPPVLTVLGNAALLSRPAVALVGARNASINGIRFAERLAADLGARGFVTVSGLAAGIDAACHRGSLATGTVGVVAGGIDVIYPPENEKLYAQMAEQGCIVAEMPLGFGIKAQLFPRRNRIVSGLSRGVVVIEAALKSGSLITARLAAEQGREVMAVPGSPLDGRAEGNNHLLKQGATLVTGVNDILDALADRQIREPDPTQYTGQPAENIEESEVQAAARWLRAQLSPSPQPVDVVIRLCERPAPVVMAALLELELAGVVMRLPGHQVALLVEPLASAE